MKVIVIVAPRQTTWREGHDRSSTAIFDPGKSRVVPLNWVARRTTADLAELHD